ncbi:MAG TPA: sugar phosphate nucleotidyltransferase, partial [Gemmataceae bacterium]|nr:sugar phosphate nucleotidyltransferase [Gemmataceae bacterium]
MRTVLSLILGGGRGTRLFPLTQSRSKPAMPVAGKYRLIDIPISNCINSSFNQIYVLTQFLSVSLHQHIGNTYKFDMFDRGFVEILAAQQTNERTDWYQGTADAVRQNMRYIKRDNFQDVVILSGDQLYRMDYRDLLATHHTTEADVTMAVLPITRSQAEGLGVVQVNGAGHIQGFVEKPKPDVDLSALEAPAKWLADNRVEPAGRKYLANMGIYIFQQSVLVKLLEEEMPNAADFGKDIFPKIVNKYHLQAHLFDDFWEDLGTIKSYHQVSLQLAEDNPPFEFHVPNSTIYTRMRNLPPSRIGAARLDRVRIADGCLIQDGSTIQHCIVGNRGRISRNVTMIDTVFIGADQIESDAEREANARRGQPDLGIGPGCFI